MKKLFILIFSIVIAGELEVDGKIGPKTLTVIQKLNIDRVRAYRVLRFADIISSGSFSSDT